MSKKATLLLILLIASCLILVKINFSSAENGDTWTAKASMNVGRSQLGVVAVNGKIYAIGGSTAEGFIPNTYGNHYKTQGWITNANEEYNPETDKWTTKTSMPTARYGFAVAVCQGKIFCMGGITDYYVGYYTNYTTKNEVYDPATGKWETKTPIPDTELGQANVVNDKIYFVGGGKDENITQVYAPRSDSWETKTPMPERVQCQVSTVLEDKIYVIGFSESIGFENVYSKNYVYNPATDSWSNCTGIPADTFNGKGVPWRGNWWSIGTGATTGEMASKRIYVLFMQYVNSGPLPNLVYNPIADNWTVGADEPVNRQNFAVAVLNDKLYVIGGEALDYPYPDDNYFTVTALGVVEEYTPLGYGTPDAAPEPTATESPTNASTDASTVNQTPQQPTVTIIAAASVAAIAVIGIGLFWHSRKRRN